MLALFALKVGLLLSAEGADEFVQELPSGVEVELVAIGDEAGNWWEPNGRRFGQWTPFVVLPNLRPVRGSRERIAFDPKPDLDQGESERTFVVRVVDDSPDYELETRTPFRVDRSIAGRGGLSRVYPHEVADDAGRRLANWQADEHLFSAGVEPTSVSVGVRGLIWTKVADIEIDAEAERAYRQVGGASIAAFVEESDAGKRLHLYYGRKDRCEEARFTVYHSDETTETVTPSVAVFDQTRSFTLRRLPAGFEPSYFERVVIEVRDVDVVTFSGVAFDPDRRIPTWRTSGPNQD